jgi:hypothetical protein
MDLTSLIPSRRPSTTYITSCVSIHAPQPLHTFSIPMTYKIIIITYMYHQQLHGEYQAHLISEQVPPTSSGLSCSCTLHNSLGYSAVFHIEMFTPSVVALSYSFLYITTPAWLGCMPRSQELWPHTPTHFTVSTLLISTTFSNQL